jgi:hypothetical protein
MNKNKEKALNKVEQHRLEQIRLQKEQEDIINSICGDSNFADLQERAEREDWE